MRTVIAWALLSASLVGVEHAWPDTGDLDPTFGTRGVVVTTDPMGVTWQAVVQQADGRLVVGGSAAIGDRDFELARFLADGTLDPSFDGDGIVVTDLGTSSVLRALAIQPDGKIVAVGIASYGGRNTGQGTQRLRMCGYVDYPPCRPVTSSPCGATAPSP